MCSNFGVRIRKSYKSNLLVYWWLISDTAVIQISWYCCDQWLWIPNFFQFQHYQIWWSIETQILVPWHVLRIHIKTQQAHSQVLHLLMCLSRIRWTQWTQLGTRNPRVVHNPTASQQLDTPNYLRPLSPGIFEDGLFWELQPRRWICTDLE